MASSINFNQDASLICVSSDHGTVHIFAAEDPKRNKQSRSVFSWPPRQEEGHSLNDFHILSHYKYKTVIDFMRLDQHNCRRHKKNKVDNFGQYKKI